VKVAVIGASGFVGGHVVRYLRQHGYAVRAVARRRHSLDSAIEWRQADACEVYAMRDALSGCDCVVHAALGTNQEIVDSVAPVYAAAEANGMRRLVYISSGSVHGQSPKRGTDERSSLSVRHGFAYNTAKVRAERRLKQLRVRGTVETVVLRPTIVFGPGSRWVYDFADALQAGRAVVVDQARGICNSIYVDNLAYAVDLALTQSGVDGQTFLVSDAETVRWSDLFRPIASALGYDFDRVPTVSPPDPSPSFRQLYLDPMLTSTFGRAALRALSRDTKDAAKALLRRTRRMAAPAGELSQPAPCTPSLPHVTPEMIALQRCQWRLPSERAARKLGYKPPVTFDEGCRRSIEWLLKRNAAASAS
jgi:2-alkyl-3-oxoalkanoate reductase